jgi:hypothetical protein
MPVNEATTDTVRIEAQATEPGEKNRIVRAGGDGEVTAAVSDAGEEVELGTGSAVGAEAEVEAEADTAVEPAPARTRRIPKISAESATAAARTMPMPRVPDSAGADATRTMRIPNLAADPGAVISNAVRDAAAEALTMQMPAVQVDLSPSGAPTEPLPVLREDEAAPAIDRDAEYSSGEGDSEGSAFSEVRSGGGLTEPGSAGASNGAPSSADHGSAGVAPEAGSGGGLTEPGSAAASNGALSATDHSSTGVVPEAGSGGGPTEPTSDAGPNGAASGADHSPTGVASESVPDGVLNSDVSTESLPDVAPDSEFAADPSAAAFGGSAPAHLPKPVVLAEAATVSFRSLVSAELVLPETVAEVVAVVDAASKAIAAAEDAARQVAEASAARSVQAAVSAVLDLREPAQPAPVAGVLDLLAPVLERPLLEVERPVLPSAPDLMALHRAEFEVDFVEPPLVAAGDEPPIPARFGPGLAVLPHIEFPV